MSTLALTQLNNNNKISMEEPKYKIIKKLSNGAFSKVYLAKKCNSHNDEELFAIKSLSYSINSMESINKEVKIHSLVSNIDGIIPLNSFHHGKKHSYLIMPFLKNGDLFDYIKENEYLEENESKRIIKHLAITIKKLHDLNIFHRDIKPENILLDKFGKPILIDFGLSTFNFNNPKTPCGTLAYSAPELINNSKNINYGKEIDIYGLGCILFTMLCGYPPFYRNENKKKLINRILNGDWEFDINWSSHISNDAKNIVKRLLCLDKNNRMTIDELLNDPWLDDIINDNNNNNDFDINTIKNNFNYKNLNINNSLLLQRREQNKIKQ